MISEFLTKPISFHAPLVDVSGSVNAGLMLSQALFWTKVVEKFDTDGWFFKKQEDWYEETRLSRHEQEGARNKLKRLSGANGTPLWEERLSGVPAKLYFRINLAVLDELLLATLNKPNKQDCQEPTNKIAEKRHTVMPESGNLYIENTLENTLEDISFNAPTEQPALISDADVKPSNPVKAPKKEPKQSTEQQIWFDAICKTVGWDYHVITKDQIGQVAQTVGVLQKAGYTIDDLRAFYKSWFESDWRGKQGQRPTLTQVRSEIGKLKADAVPAPVVDSRLSRIAILS